jgi:hypothetical protein
VDRNGGCSFVDIQSAILAAQPGDTILVRAGEYEGFGLDKGVQVLGDPGVVLTGTRGASVSVSSVPLGQTEVVRGFRGFVRRVGHRGHRQRRARPPRGTRRRWAVGDVVDPAQPERQRGRRHDHTSGLEIEQSTVAMTRCAVTGRR